MQNLFTCLKYFAFLVCAVLKLAAQEECVLIIQGVRDKPDEDFFNNSSDAMAAAMAAFQPMPNITVLRPKNESSNLKTPPKRNEKNYKDKEDLLKLIEEAICDAKCKNVVISFIGHGMGSTGINNAPTNNKAGGMKVGPGNTTTNDYLTAADMAEIIDKCKKSVKLIPSQCFAESMINGIVDELKNKHLVGVAVGSSPWDKKSYGDIGGIYHFLKYFLEDYYLILGDPNVMEQIKKNAAELKKKNEQKNKEIEAENKAIQEKIKTCEKEYADLTMKRDALQKQTDEKNKEKENAENAIKLLEIRKTLETALDGEKDKNKQKMLKDTLKKNADALKAIGVTGLPTSGKLDKKLEKLMNEIVKQQAKANAAKAILEKVAAEWAVVNPAHVAKGAMLEDLKASIKAIIPDHTPIMELVIHEAFKSAQEKTKSSMPVEPVVPVVTGKVDLPATPPTHVEVKNQHFYFRKVIDQKTNKCTVVGYRADSNGNPIGPITTKECDISCKNLNFSYQDGNATHDVKASLNEDTKKYDFFYDNEKVAFYKAEYRKAELILPGQLLAEVHFQTFFNQISDVVVPGWETFDLQYNEENSRLTFKINKESEIHEVVMRFLKHEDIRIKIDQQITYLLSQTRNFSLLSNSGLQNGKLALILLEDQIIGCMQNCNSSTPVGIAGQWASDHERYILFSSEPTFPFQVIPHPDNTSLMLWQHAGQTGILYHDILIEPIIKQFHVEVTSEGRNQLYWELFLEHLIHGDLARFKYMMVVVQEANGFSQAYPIPQSQNTWIDPIPRLNQELNYRLYAVSQDPSYSVAYLGPYFDLTGTQECFTQQGGATLRNKIKTENQDRHSYAIHIVPNPFSDVSTFQIYSSESIRGTLLIYGLDGSTIWKAEHFIQKGSNILEIPGSLFPLPGLYYYQWFDGVQSYYGKMQKN